nr:hypothetical protein [uncultured Ottowia sp.]
MATLTRASFQTAYNIQSRSLDDGILGVSRNGNLHKTLDELRGSFRPASVKAC